MRGRKNTPIALDGAERIPQAPAELTEDAAQEWSRVAALLHARGTLAELDRGILAAYCQAYGRWAQAERELADPETGGLLLRTSNGNVVQHPLVGIANKAMTDLAKFASELGMTPTARARVGEKLGKKEEADLAALTAERGTSWEHLLQ